MTRRSGKSQNAGTRQPTLQMPRAEAEQRLLAQIEKGKQLLQLEIRNQSDLDAAKAEQKKWSDYNRELLVALVDTDCLVKDYYPAIGYVRTGRESLSTLVKRFERRVTDSITQLESVLGRLELIPEFPPLASVGSAEQRSAADGAAYVNPVRMGELRAISSTQFDLAKLIRLCEELNTCYAGECCLAVAMLTRAILDDVSPIFGFKSFTQAANNYGGAGRSVKGSMQRLEESSRKIADTHLHLRIRKKEVLPNKTQVDFSNELDVLLAEIVRILK